MKPSNIRTCILRQSQHKDLPGEYNVFSFVFGVLLYCTEMYLSKYSGLDILVTFLLDSLNSGTVTI